MDFFLEAHKIRYSKEYYSYHASKIKNNNMLRVYTGGKRNTSNCDKLPCTSYMTGEMGEASQNLIS